MGINIKNESQQLINNFNEVTGDDKGKAMVVMSTSTNQDDDNRLLLACTGTGSMILNIQATSIVESFKHMMQNGTIKNPTEAAGELVSTLSKEIFLAASGATNGKD